MRARCRSDLTKCAPQFFDELLNYIDIPVLSIHGKQKQTKRTATFFEFCNAEKGILVCTDVAARGLDIPAVDWIIQYDPPDDTAEYIHRVGRTARYVSAVRGVAMCSHGVLDPALAVPAKRFCFCWRPNCNT